MKTTHLLLFTVAALSICSCKKAKDTEAEMLSMAQETSELTWYKNNDALLDKSPGSSHPQAQLRVGYNSTAVSVLDENYEIVEGTVFPEGSFIAKELWQDGAIERWAMMWKQPSNEFADANGWVWGYINDDESVAEPASNKGEACISCHSQSGHIDMTLMNLYFP